MTNKNNPEYDDQLFSYGDTEWSSKEWVMKHIHTAIDKLIKDESLSSEQIGVIREAQLKRRRNKFIEYKVMLDTHIKMRLLFETASANGDRHNTYRPGGFATCEALYWHIECYNIQGEYVTFIFTTEELQEIFKDPEVEVIDTPEKALEVHPYGMPTQYKMGYSVPFDVLLNYYIKKTGFTNVSYNPNEGRTVYRPYVDKQQSKGAENLKRLKQNLNID